MSAEKPDLRERTRQAVRAQLMAVAWDLFVEQGYDATTVDEIAAAVGMSQRSFFRYFGSKEDVVLVKFEAVGVMLADELARRPVSEDVWTALRRSFDGIVETSERDPRYGLLVLRITDRAPVLRARRLEQQTHWQELLAPLVATRLDPPATDADHDPRPAALAAAALACLNVANAAWLDSDGTESLRRLLDDAMRAVHPGAF
ncbi:TetR/AcrR family transcriptional regulator [Saccharothrix deserti]|uniref:TetR/AcrR family transcriptional regulator n=1 Tax=Saccharothrix deserti TaxID=2593674 RepID=UPI00192E3AED|nr:TetR/AcrR family transcriptional regulator [Saccharothrix deserti]